MNFKKMLMSMVAATCLLDNTSTAKEIYRYDGDCISLVEKGTPLTQGQQKEYQQKILGTEFWKMAPQDIKDGLNFSKACFTYKIRMKEDNRELAGLRIPLEGKYARPDLMLVYQDNYANGDFFRIIRNILKPEYIMPQYPKNEQYEKVSEKRFKLPPSAKERLTPKQFEEVSTLMHIVKKDIDFLMNEPFGKITALEVEENKYAWMINPTHIAYNMPTQNQEKILSYFRSKETPLEFKLNNKLGRFLSLKEIAQFDNKLYEGGETLNRKTYSTEGGHAITGVLFAASHFSGTEGEKIINFNERSEVKKSFTDFMKVLQKQLQKQGLDIQNLPDIKSPTVPVYNKCLAYIYTQAKDVHDIVMESKVLEEHPKDGGILIQGALADYISIDPKSPGLIQERIEQDKVRREKIFQDEIRQGKRIKPIIVSYPPQKEKE